MINTYIFDFGNVLANFYPEKLTAPYVGDETEIKYLSEVIFNRSIWDRLDDGTYSDEDAKREIRKSLPDEKHEVACTVFDNWINNLTPVPGMCELVSDIRKGGKSRIYLLSNISRRFAASCRNVPWINELFDNFDGLVFSGTLGIAKPAKEIFEYTVNTFGIKAQECLFIDDNENNIKGAQAVGIKGYLFDGDAVRLRNTLNNP